MSGPAITEQVTSWGLVVPVWRAHIRTRQRIRQGAAELARARHYRSAVLCALVGELYGVAYYWGGECTIGEGFDCTGLSSVVLTRLEALGFGVLLHPGRRWAGDLGELPVARRPYRPGDQVLYGSSQVEHSATWLGLGSLLLTTQGGDSNTRANDPGAYTGIQPWGYWRSKRTKVVRPWL